MKSENYLQNHYLEEFIQIVKGQNIIVFEPEFFFNLLLEAFTDLIVHTLDLKMPIGTTYRNKLTDSDFVDIFF